MARFWSGRTLPKVVHHGALLVRPDPAEGGVGAQRVGQLRGFRRQLARIHRLAAQPQLAGDGADRNRVVAGQHLDRHALFGKVIQRLARVRAHLLFEDHQRRWGDAARRVGVIDGDVTGADQ
jgi:hypothetical protein